jgi:hypothetical protein
MHVISPSHVPPNQDRQGKKVQGIIFVRAQEPNRVSAIIDLFLADRQSDDGAGGRLREVGDGDLPRGLRVIAIRSAE